MMAKLKHLSDDTDTHGTRSRRKCFKTAMARILAVLGIVLVVLMMIIVHYVVALDRIEKLHQLKILSSQHEKQQNEKLLPHSNHISPDIELVKVSGPTSNDDAIESLKDYDQSLDVQHLRARILHHRQARFVPDMLDPVFLQHELDFDSLYAKVRNKRTRLELSKLEKEYFRCKKESINSSGCMVAFTQLYSLAKEISEKMDKMKDIFDKNEEVLERSEGSDSRESKEYKQKITDKASTQNEENNEEVVVRSTTETSFNVDNADDGQKNTSLNNEDKHIHYSWIIDGPDDRIHVTAATKESIEQTGTSGNPEATKAPATIESARVTAASAIAPNVTDSLPAVSTYKPTNASLVVVTDTSVEPLQVDTEKSHNDTGIVDSEIESHKISWILDGFDSDREVIKPEDRPQTTGTTAKLLRTDITSEATQQVKTTHDDKPEKISWIIDGHHEEDVKEDEKLVSTTKSVLVKELTTKVAEEITWILDENENDEEDTITETTLTPTQQQQAEDKPDRISWIIDGNDDSIDIAATTQRVTATSMRDTFQELELVTEGVDTEEDKLRKLKYDTIAGEEAEAAARIRDFERVAHTTLAPEMQSTYSLVMNRTVTLSNATGVTIIYGGDCATTPQPAFTKLDEESGRTKLQGNSSQHPLDNPTSLENMLESAERQLQPKTNKEESTTIVTKNTSVTIPSAYDPHIWEDLFRKSSVVQQDELIDAFDAEDVPSMMKNGAKLNAANIDAFQDIQFMSLCEQVAKRLRNRGGYRNTSNVTPAPSSHFTSRGPGGFPVTGETMKATAQFLYNPNFGMPTIPICFYITPANFRMVNQNPMWTQGFQSFQGMQNNYMSTSMGFNTNNGVFFVPQQSFGPTAGFFAQTGATGGGGNQGNMANMFSKNASPQKQQQQQFFCTYMQNNGNNNKMTSASGIGGGAAMNAMSFSNANFKMRTSAQNLSTDIIYASYTSIPDHLGHADHYECDSPEEIGCYSGKECIRKSSWCDNLVDCHDGSDEAACRCIDRLAKNRICDGYADCPMGEDELGCFDCTDASYSCYDGPEEFAEFHRSTVSMCYSSIEKCDGVMNCLNGRDELECNIIVKDVKDHMSHAVSSSSGFLFHNYRGDWYPVCNNAEKWAYDACANEADQSTKPHVSFREITLQGPFIEPTVVGQVHFPQSCQQRSAGDELIDQATYVNCASTACGRVKKKKKAPFRQKRSRVLAESSQLNKERQKREVSDERIVGGSYSAPMQWPFVVAIYRDGKFHCGGTIYNEDWILSAAHCVINYHKYYYEIRAGTLRRSSFASSAQIRSVTHVVAHQAYERRSMRNDLSLLRMNEPLMFNRWVKPICLPDMGRSTAGDDWIWGPEENTLCTAVGWGAVREKGPGSDQLREVVVPIRKQCIELDDKMSENVCAGDVNGGRDACQGDSGGPLFCRSVSNTDEWYLAGIVSHGNGCARPGEVGAYTRVSLYLDWIEMALKYPAKIKPRSICPGYTCVWGGKRCITAKRRCDRIVDCLGGEDEVGCFYNFIPDMVGSSLNMTKPTTESDYYPEDVVTSPPCKPAKTAPDARMKDEEEEEKKEKEEEEDITVTVPDTAKQTAADTATQIVLNASTKTHTIENPTKINTMRTSFPESSTKQTSTVESSTEEVATEGSTTEVSTTARDTTESTTTGSTLGSTETSTIESSTETTTITTSTVQTTTEITTDSPSTPTSTVATTVELSTTSETSTLKISTEGPYYYEATKMSPTPFDVQNLVTTMRDTVISPATIYVTPPVPEIARTEGTTIATVTEKQRKYNNSGIPGKFVCQKIPQIVEQTNRCDRILDCEDGTDEEACSCRDFLKGTLNLLICDGKADCEDLTDEENCDNCQSNEFLCPLSKTCVSLKKRCDGIIDCDFKEDEKDCFALTNGREITLDADKRPTLNSAGIFSRNSHGKWRVVCTHEIPLFEQIVNTASSVCSQLGFKSLKFYNITEFMSHDTIVPIHPDIHKPKNIHAHFSSISADNHQFANNQRQFRPTDFGNKARTIFIERTSVECSGLFVECEAKANNVEPIKTISAGGPISLDSGSSSGLRPALETYGKPNVYVTPPTSSLILLNKKDEILDKMQKVIESRKNISLLIDNKLHEAVEEMHWPWVVDVYVDGRLWCVGALVDRYWVLVHESCQFGVRFPINYIAVLLGGGKTKRLRHKSTHEQIRRVDCLERVPKSEVLLYHLEKPAHFTHHVLPTFLPDFSPPISDGGQQCIAILHDDNSGRIKTVTAIDERHDALCKSSDMSCYRLVERKPPKDLVDELGVSDEDFINLSEEVLLKEALDDEEDAFGAAISRFTTCTQFGKKNISRNALEPVDQGILACRQTNTGWYPMALFDYNNTNCDSFKDALALRSLEKVYGTIQTLIDKPKCEQPSGVPACTTFRCKLGECLDDAKICDGISDCHDGADEERKMCIGKKKVCQPSELKCRTSYKCVPKTKFCDHIADCDDMTDEPTLCSCYTYLQATDPKKICDGIRNCWDKSDESPALCNCTANHFRCGKSANECVPRDFVCDKEPDCPNGEDERYCYGIEFPQQTVTGKANLKQTSSVHPKQPEQYGQVIEQAYGVWHTKCFPRSNPPDVHEVRKICKSLGYSPYKQPSYRIIDDAAMEVVETNEWPDQRGRSFGREEESPLPGRYRSATKAVVVSKFSPLSLNNELTLFLKPSRPIAEIARWNRTDSENCYRLEIRCM